MPVTVMSAVSHDLLRSSALRALEHAAHAALPPHTLMTRAATAAFDLIRARWPARWVTILCGPGNNGGDGLVLARLLHQADQPVRVWAQAPTRDRPDDAARAWRELPAGLVQAGEPHGDANGELIVDSLFGIGLRKGLDDTSTRWLSWANEQAAVRLALDVPTGLNADTGTADPHTFRADVTLTFLRDKPGLHTHAGRDHAGEVVVASLGTDSEFAGVHADAFAPAGVATCEPASADIGKLIRRSDCAALFQARPHDTHKGSFGTVAVLGGGRGMTGAALLASRAALHLGAGKVFVAFPAGAPDLPCDPLQPELMLRTADALLAQDDAGVGVWVMGCGLGTDDDAAGSLAAVLDAAGDTPVVLDADGLTLLAEQPHLAQQRTAPLILTPHPREAARLLHTDTATIQDDRIRSATDLAARYEAWVVLKGSGTVVASPDGLWSINDSGNAGLATAGTGDVLAGMIGGLLAQGLPIDDAVRGGVWLHGAAADALVAQGCGPVGLTASEVFIAARRLRNVPSPSPAR